MCFVGFRFVHSRPPKVTGGRTRLTEQQGVSTSYVNGPPSRKEVESVRPSFSCLLTQGGGRFIPPWVLYNQKKPLVVCVCRIFAAMMADEQQLCWNTKKRETQLCDGFAVCGRSYFRRRSAFSRVHLFFLYRGKVRRSLDEFVYLYMTQCCSPSCTTHTRPTGIIYIKREAKNVGNDEHQQQ